MKAARRAGVTMIELLVVIAVLLTIVVSLSAVLTGGDKTVTEGGQRADTDASAQTAVSQLLRDLRHGIADGGRPFVLDDGGDASYGFTNSVLSFYTLDQDAVGAERDFRGVVYSVTEIPNAWGVSYAIVRTADATDTALPGRVAALRLAVPEAGALLRHWTSTNAPPFVDIYLELLDEGDARRAAALSDPIVRAVFVDTKVRRFTVRAATMGGRP